MSAKSAKRLKLEESLREDPSDSFLRYGLGLQCLREGDIQAGRKLLEDLITEHPDDQVAALQQLGQSFMEEGAIEPARRYFQRGIAVAEKQGDAKAAGEMRGFLAMLE
jgi:Tfp pilus assembly protein PilF